MKKAFVFAIMFVAVTLFAAEAYAGEKCRKHWSQPHCQPVVHQVPQPIIVPAPVVIQYQRPVYYYNGWVRPYYVCPNVYGYNYNYSYNYNYGYRYPSVYHYNYGWRPVWFHHHR